ncbi:MAG: hypothetical protein ACPHRO_05355, partial [Nannocystaceae bacterium]
MRQLGIGKGFVETAIIPANLSVTVKFLGFEFQVFQRANAQRRSENLGGPILMGWSPPMLSDGDSWTLEFWLVTQFDGQHGTALVCMVDIDNESVAKHYMTEVSIR